MSKSQNKLLHLNDLPGTYPNSYYAATANQQIASTPLAGDQQADVCVIGAGYTGLSTALHLAQHGYHVIVLDAHRVGWGASGRNGGQAEGSQRLDQMELEEMVGLDLAKKAWALSQQAMAKVKSLISEHNIQCDLAPGIMEVNHRARFNAETRTYVDHIQSNYDYADIEYLDKPALDQVLGATGYHGGLIWTDYCHLHPLNYALGMAKAAQDAGAVIHENSEVLTIESGARPTAVTRSGRVSASAIVVACNGYLGELYSPAGTRTFPINNFIAATEQLSEAEATRLIANNAAVADSRFVINYFRLSADRRMLFGGGESYGYKFPDIDRTVRQAMRPVFPDLAQRRFEYTWGGTLAITMSRLPVFTRADNIYAACGYSGAGVALASFAGELLSDAIRGDVERFDLMGSLPTPKVPGGSLFRRPLLMLAMFWYAMRDKL